MNAHIICPSCRKTLQVPALAPGQVIACPICLQQWCPIPGAAASAPPRPSSLHRRVAPPLPLDEEDLPPRPVERSASKLGLVVAGIVVVILAVGGATAFVLLKEPDRPRRGPTAERRANEPEAAAPAPAPSKPTATVPIASTEKTVPRLPPLTVAKSAALTGEKVYERLIPSTIFILSGDKDGAGRFFVSAGSGALVNKDRRLAVTNYHVVGEMPRVFAFFPARDSRNELITSPAHYVENIRTLGITAKVVARDSNRDLAVLELERVPDFALTLPLAEKVANPGSQVYSIGASGIHLQDFSGSLWRLSSGSVRGRYRDTLRFPDGQTISAMFLETQKPINSGDSGGPTVNDRGELVALVSVSKTRQDLVKLDIDLSEVREYLGEHARKDGWTWTDMVTDNTVMSLSDPSVLEALVAVLRDGEPGDRATAARRLADLGAAAQSTVPSLLLALEASPPELTDAVAAALARIGPPPDGSESALTRALVAKSEVARAYAARTLAEGKVVPSGVVPTLAAACQDPSAAVRAAVLRALALAGEAGRSTSLAAAVGRLTDSDADVRKAAKDLLTKYQPFGESDRPMLLKSLAHADPGIRAAAAGWLAPLVTDPREAATRFAPLLKDSATEVRLAGLHALQRLPDSLPAVGAAIAPLVDDPDPTLSVAALTAALHLKNQPGLEPRVASVFKSTTDARIRGAAAAALVQVIEPHVDRVPLLRQLFKEGNPEARRLCLGKYQELCLYSNDVHKDILEATTDADETVRIVAYGAIRATESLARNSVPVCQAAFERPQETEAVRAVAISALAVAGPEGMEALTDLTAHTHSPKVTLELCQALVQKGAQALALQTWLFRRAEESEECRAALAPFFPKHADAQSIQELLLRTDFYKKARPGEGVTTYPPEVRKWAITVLGDLNYKSLSSDAVKNRLRTLANRPEDMVASGPADLALRKILRVKSP